MDWLILILGIFAGYFGTEWWRYRNPVDAGMMLLAFVAVVIHISA